MNMEFKIGGVVKLISGGPDMTIDKKPDNESDRIYCVWFVKESSGNYTGPFRDSFDKSHLEHIKTT